MSYAMTPIETIQKKVRAFNYRGLADALADMRALLEEIERFKNENSRLLFELKNKP